MSHQEVDRLQVVQAVVTRQVTQAAAAEQLGLSVRQVKRLVRGYRRAGAAGLLSRHRGRRANNAIALTVRTAVLALARERYPDFGPTLMHEKLVEAHGYRLSVETLRQWLIADGLWQPRQRKIRRPQPPRPRRPRFGELIQIDGSPHDWFEGRAPACTLIVFVDDATSRLLALRFVPAETTRAYMDTCRDYLSRHGRPVAVYADKHSIFRINQGDQAHRRTQLARALDTLDIGLIHAHSPQAKGRVERANQTLQDRLVKEMRLQGIHDPDAANAWLPAFIDDYNRRFAVPPAQPDDAHRPVRHNDHELNLIFSQHHHRKLNKQLCCQLHNRTYHITGKGHGYRLRGANVLLCKTADGTVHILYQGQPLAFRLLTQGQQPLPVDDHKTVYNRVNELQQRQQKRPHYKPPPDHPWRQYANTL